MAYCNHCGKALRSGASFCSHCGAKDGKIEARTEKIKTSMPPRTPETHSPSKEKKRAKAGIAAPEVKNRRAIIIKAVAKGLIKGLLLSAVVLGPGIILLIQEKQVLGMLWLFTGSFGMMVWTYRKPWRLLWITCLLPPCAALVSYLIQLVLFGVAMPPGMLLLAATGAGLLVGYLRARTHTVYVQDGGIFAQRTTKYLVIWIIAFGSTQILGGSARSIFLVASGLLTGAFTTAMLLVVSLVLLSKRASLTKSITH